MALVVVQAPPLSADAKRRIGERILQALHDEKVPASQVVVLFQPERSDLYLEGGLLVEASPGAPAPDPAPPPPARPPAPAAAMLAPSLDHPRERLVALLQEVGAVTSFQAQEHLGLKDDEQGAAILRRLFKGLEAQGRIVKQGQKRGMRYVWVEGQRPGDPEAPPAALLVKRPLEDERED